MPMTGMEGTEIFVSVAGRFHLVQVLELGSLGLQTLGTVNFFR
jgi:hypothetical protein